MRKGFLALSICTIMILGASMLQAVPPLSFEGSFSAVGLVGYCEDQGFWVYEDVDIFYQGKNYFDKQGNLVKQRIHNTVEGVVFNESAPEMTLPYKNVAYTDHYDAETDEVRITGLFALVTIPGYGNIFIDVGVVVYDYDTGTVTFEAGKHQWWDGNVEAMCELLTP